MNNLNMPGRNLSTQFDFSKNDSNGDRLLGSNVVTSSMVDITEIPDEQAMRVALEGLEMPDNISLYNLDDFDKKISDSNPFKKNSLTQEDPHDSINPAEISDLILSILDKTESEIQPQLPMIVENIAVQEKPIEGVKDHQVEQELQEKSPDNPNHDTTDQQSEEPPERKTNQYPNCSEEEPAKIHLDAPAKHTVEDSEEQKLKPQDPKPSIDDERKDHSMSKPNPIQKQQLDDKCKNHPQQSDSGQLDSIKDKMDELPGPLKQKQSDKHSLQQSDKTQDEHVDSKQTPQKGKETGDLEYKREKTPKTHVINQEEPRVDVKRISNQRKRKLIMPESEREPQPEPEPKSEPEPEPECESTEVPELGRRRSKRNLNPAKAQQSSPETSQSKTTSDSANDSKSEQEESFVRGAVSKAEGKLAKKASGKSLKTKHSKKSIEPPKISLQRRPSKRPHESDEEERIDKPATKSTKKQPREKLIHKFTKINPPTTTTNSFNDRRSLPASSIKRSDYATSNSEPKRHRCFECNSYDTDNLNLFVIHRQRFCENTLASYQERVDEYKLSLVKPKVNKRSSTK